MRIHTWDHWLAGGAHTIRYEDAEDAVRFARLLENRTRRAGLWLFYTRTFGSVTFKVYKTKEERNTEVSIWDCVWD
jgi:hypothetical protein